MKWLATTVVCVLALLAVRYERTHLQAWRLRERAETSYYAGDLDKTLARYEAVIERRPRQPRSYTDPADSITQYLRGVGPEFPSEEFEQRTWETVELYLRALDADPSSAWVYGRLALLAESWGQRREVGVGLDLARLSGNVATLTPQDRFAEAAWAKAVRIEPRNFYYRDYLGTFYLRRGFRERAFKHMRYAVRLQPVLEKHYYLSDFAEASPEVLQAVELGVRDALAAADTQVSLYDIHRFLADLYLRLDRVEDARRSLEAAVTVAPKPHLVEIQIGELLARQGDDAGALQAFRRATDTSPDYYRGWAFLAMTLSRLGDHEAAIEAANRARALNPTDFGVTSALARVLDAGGELEAASEILEYLIRTDPDNYTSYTQLIRIYEEREMISDATRIARLLAERFPDEPAYRRQLEQLERSRSGR